MCLRSGLFSLFEVINRTGLSSPIRLLLLKQLVGICHQTTSCQPMLVWCSSFVAAEATVGEVEANSNNFLTFRRRPHAVVYVQLRIHMSMCMYRRTYKSMQACLFYHTFIYISTYMCMCMRMYIRGHIHVQAHVYDSFIFFSCMLIHVFICFTVPWSWWNLEVHIGAADVF